MRGLVGTLVVIGSLVGAFFFPKQFFFPASVAYVGYGLLKTALSGLLDARVYGEEAPGPAIEVVGALPGEDIDAGKRVATGKRRRRRRRRGGGGTAGGGAVPGGSPPDENI